MALTKVGKEGITGISNSSDATAITIDSSERVGIGITPDTTSNGKSLQINRSVINDDDGGSTHITQNGYYNSAWKYVEDGTAEKISFVSGTIRFDNASSNSSGADASLSWSERMRIDTSGRLLIGTTSTSYNDQGGRLTGGNLQLTNSDGQLIRLNRTTAAGNLIELWYNGGEKGSISTNGSNVSYNTSSDYRLKENVKTDWDASTRLKQLKPSQFNWKVDKDTTVDGFLAHEVSSIVPEAVSGEKDAVDKEGNPQYQGIDQSKLVPLLTKSLQEALARIETLEAKVKTLEEG